RNHDRQRAAGTVVQDMASALFGVDGLQVIEADAERDGWVTVWVVTDHPGAAVCPECGTRSVRVHEQVLARPRDVRRGLDEVRVAWLKRRWKCGNDGCARKTFTESLPAVRARCRLTERLRGLAGAEVAERGCTVAEAARWQRVSWPVAHQEFARHADCCPSLGMSVQRSLVVSVCGYEEAPPAVAGGASGSGCRGGAHSVVTSVTAARAEDSSTMALPAVNAASRAATAMLLTARG